MQKNNHFLPILLLLATYTAYGHLVCPSHSEIKSYAHFHEIEYNTKFARMVFNLNVEQHQLSLTFNLPASPPFTRPASSHFNNSTFFNRGEVNWGFTDHYKTDFATVLLDNIVYRNAYQAGNQVDCLYMSILENYFLYGHIWIPAAH